MASLGIGIFAPSSPLDPEVFKKVESFVSAKGHELVIESHPSEFYGRYDFLFSAGSVESRLESFYNIANNPRVSLLLLARGGYGSMELLESFRPQRIRRRSDLIVSGFSDATALLFALLGRKHVQAVHGPTASSFASGEPLASQHLDELLCLFNMKENNYPLGQVGLNLLCGNPHEAVRGQLIGGNLSVCTALLGTPWSPKLGRAIFFFEDTGVKPYALHRMLLQLKLSSKLRSVTGVLVGNLKDCSHLEGKGPGTNEVLRDIFEPLRIPVYVEAPFGHAGRIAPLPLGRKAAIEKGILRLL